MSDIFISYSHEDKEYAHRLEKELKQRGFKVWIDDRINYGTEWPTFIQDNLDGCKALILIMTPRSLKSVWVQNELTRARRKKKTIFPLLLEGDEPWLSIETIQYVDVTNGQLPHEEFYKTLGNVFSKRKKTPPEPVEEKRPITAPKATRQKRLANGIVAVAMIAVLSVIGWFLYSEYKYPKTFKNSIGMEFKLIPAGSFMRGPKKEGDSYRDLIEYPSLNDLAIMEKKLEDEHAQHEVKISKPIYLQSTEVTQGQWEKVMGNNPSKFKDCGDDCPVEQVSWDDSQEFISKLNEMEGTYEYRLPTEAEWEYACLAEITSDYSPGDDPSTLLEYAWYSKYSQNRTHPVGKKKPNAWGLYDMRGNVWEWCQDLIEDGKRRVARGGSWNSDQGDARCAGRDRAFPADTSLNSGFRCVKIK